MAGPTGTPIDPVEFKVVEAAVARVKIGKHTGIERDVADILRKAQRQIEFNVVRAAAQIHIAGPCGRIEAGFVRHRNFSRYFRILSGKRKAAELIVRKCANFRIDLEGTRWFFSCVLCKRNLGHGDQGGREQRGLAYVPFAVVYTASLFEIGQRPVNLAVFLLKRQRARALSNT